MPSGFMQPSGPSLDRRHFQVSHMIVLTTTLFSAGMFASARSLSTVLEFWSKKKICFGSLSRISLGCILILLLFAVRSCPLQLPSNLSLVPTQR